MILCADDTALIQNIKSGTEGICMLRSCMKSNSVDCSYTKTEYTITATAGQRKFQHGLKNRSNLGWNIEHVLTKYLTAKSRVKRARAAQRDDRIATAVKNHSNVSKPRCVPEKPQNACFFGGKTGIPDSCFRYSPVPVVTPSSGRRHIIRLKRTKLS